MSLFANVDIGSNPNDGTGDPLRDAFKRLNENFQLLNQLFSSNGSAYILSNVAIYTDSYFYANGVPFIGGGGGTTPPPSAGDLDGGTPTSIADATIDGGGPSTTVFDTVYDGGGV